VTLPKQAEPIIRSLSQTQSSVENSDVIASAASDCYSLSGGLRRICLLAHTDT